MSPSRISLILIALVLAAIAGALVARQSLQLPTPTELVTAIVLVSIDPERDTPEKLASYVAQFDPSVIGVTGPSVAIDEFATSVGVAHQKVPMRDGDYMVDHSAFILLLDPEGRQAAVFSPPHDADRLAADYLRMLAHG